MIKLCHKHMQFSITYNQVYFAIIIIRLFMTMNYFELRYYVFSNAFYNNDALFAGGISYNIFINSKFGIH